MPAICYDKVTYQGRFLTASVANPMDKIINKAGCTEGERAFTEPFAFASAKVRKGKAVEKRKLKELNLLDDFLFNTMVTHPEIGEQFCRILLGMILGRSLGRLEIIAQRTYYGCDTDLHGARLDVCLEETKESGRQGYIYDVEPGLYGRGGAAMVYPRRVRFYHAQIDADSLRSGQDYALLKNVYVIVITPFDPFGLNRMLYTIRRSCEEEPYMYYEDGDRTLFLYTRGTKGDPPEELAQLLHYMEDSTEANAVNEKLRTLHGMVERVKQDRKVAVHYMKIFEREQMLLEEGREEERANTERERAKAERERKRAETAERQVRELEKELEALRKQMLFQNAHDQEN